jgi:F0F1-type ATP synthase membrane subunit b/b'
MLNEHFFVALSFAAFITVAYKPVKKMVFDVLYKYSQDIANDSKQAEIARAEAENELNKVKQRAAKIEEEIGCLIDEAKAESQMIMNEAKSQVNHILTNRTRMALQKIAQEEAKTQRLVREELVSHIFKVVESSLNGISDETKEDLIVKGLQNSKKLLH